MSLVAYESSDESSENEENETAETTIGNNNNTLEVTTVQTVQTDLKFLPVPKVVSESTNDEEEKEDTRNFRNFLGMLPKPKDLNSEKNTEENDEILLKKESLNHITKPIKRQIIKITVPSLSEVNVTYVIHRVFLIFLCRKVCHQQMLGLQQKNPVVY